MSATVQGWDFGLYYNLDDTPVGDFSFTLNAALLDEVLPGRLAEWRDHQPGGGCGAIPAVLRRELGRATWCASSAGRNGATPRR